MLFGMAPSTKGDKVTGEVNNRSRPLMALLANMISTIKRILSCFIPSMPISFRATTFPVRVCLTVIKFREPFSLTLIIAKSLFTMKVASWASYIFTTPRAFSYLTISSTLIGSAPFTYLSTFPRAIYLIPLTSANRWLPAYRTMIHNAFAKTSQLFTFVRTIPLWLRRFVSIKRMKYSATLLTYSSSFHSHICIIPQIEIGERYCKIAVERLRQSVMRLE
jgi:hypothetical protein